MFPVVFLTLFSQAAIVLASLALPVLAPAAAADIGVSASAIGYFSSFIYLGAISSSLISVGFINRFGGIRMLQASLGLAALGVVIVASGHISLIIIGAILIGFSYGPAKVFELPVATLEPCRPSIFQLHRPVAPLRELLPDLHCPSSRHSLDGASPACSVLSPASV